MSDEARKAAKEYVAPYVRRGSTTKIVNAIELAFLDGATWEHHRLHVDEETSEVFINVEFHDKLTAERDTLRKLNDIAQSELAAHVREIESLRHELDLLGRRWTTSTAGLAYAHAAVLEEESEKLRAQLAAATAVVEAAWTVLDGDSAQTNWYPEFDGLKLALTAYDAARGKS